MKIITLISILFNFPVIAQQAYRTGDRVANLPVTQLLNQNSKATSLDELKGSNITIIDFFGTWCAPCLKALPELQTLQEEFGKELQVILVSTEKKEKLEKFINSRQPFTFPMIVDVNYTFTNTFNPPAYPYSVVLDRNMTILQITNAADLTKPLLEKLIHQNRNNAIQKPISTLTDVKKVDPADPGGNNRLVQLSQDFVYAAKTNENVEAYISQLGNLDYQLLKRSLQSDDKKKAFWINLYNAFTNTALRKDPDQYKKRNRFFTRRNILVAGKKFSLDDIEHGLLRKSKIKWSLGYLSKLFPGKIEKQLRVDKLDYRIHFALNCGAKSCPPIAFYDSEKIETQLDLAETAYLTAETEYQKEANTLLLPAILSWFRRDFGGKKKMVKLLKEKQLLPSDVKPDIRIKKYDWTIYLNNYK